RGNARYEPMETSEEQRVKAFYDLLVKQLAKDNSRLSEKELKQGLYAATLLLTYYLANSKQHDEHLKKPTLEDWQVLDKINDLLDQMDNSTANSVMMKFFSSIIFYRMGYVLPENALPILCLKNFGGNTHPIITSVGMRLLNHIPVQKILTSNTSDLIPMLTLQNVMRISRSDSEIVVNQVMPKELSASTNRKVLFHIFHRRPIALFSRCWFLVEGETEIWLLRELAEICGYNLNAEGISLVEFAQCGVLALIEYAEAMGIEWYVMSDGDAAGRHYAKTVRSHCRDKETYYQHMTQLPSRDIENFLFQKGFSSVYKEIAYGSSEFVNVPVHEIIQKAIQKSSKPDLALAVCDYARVRGARAIPNLLQKTFKKVIDLSKGAMSN
ncbi:MAG: ATP-dependent nuclease, partial [Wohlfahrtiimonas sp.]